MDYVYFLTYFVCVRLSHLDQASFKFVSVLLLLPPEWMLVFWACTVMLTSVIKSKRHSWVWELGQ